MKSNIEITSTKGKRVLVKASGTPRVFPNRAAASQYVRNHYEVKTADPKIVDAKEAE